MYEQVLESLELADWTPPTDYATHKISHGRSTATIDQKLLEEFVDNPLHSGWWARIMPGGFIVPHCDAPPYRQRWHFPVQPAGFFWEDGETTEPTEPFIVRHWLPHAVWNPTDTPRIHLMVERDVLSYEGSNSSLSFEEDLPEVLALMETLPGFEPG